MGTAAVRGGTEMLIFMALTALLAVAGIAFGTRMLVTA